VTYKGFGMKKESQKFITVDNLCFSLEFIAITPSTEYLNLQGHGVLCVSFGPLHLG
jgi:hypothetical protein